jgi:hypothetical protein
MRTAIFIFFHRLKFKVSVIDQYTMYLSMNQREISNIN